MPAQVLKFNESQEHIEQLEKQLRAELDDCIEINSTHRNKIFEFMVENAIWNIDDLDYFSRKKYDDFLKKRLGDSARKSYVKSHDKIKLHAIKKQACFRIAGNDFRKLYKNELLYLPYHPNPEIAERFKNSQCFQDLVWDFKRNASEKIKRQIYDCLHYAIENDRCAETFRVNLIGIHQLYDFCIEEGIEDIEMMELEQIAKFTENNNERLNKVKKNRVVNHCRKALFMLHEDINWNAHVWYLERMNIQPERIDPSNMVTVLSFLEVVNMRNRELLKQYMKYGIGLTNLSINNLRSEMITVRNFLVEIGKCFDEDICNVTKEQMDVYLTKEQKQDVQAETFNKKVMCILHFFGFLRVRNYIEDIPFDEKYYLKKTFQRHNDRTVSQDAFREILDNLYKFPEHLRLMYLHLYGIGLRISEVCRLKGDAYYIQGKDAWIQVYQTKMRNYKRIPIPDALYKLMKVYIEKYDIKADDYLFKNSTGEAYRSGTFRMQMIQHCRKNNIQNGEYAFKCHDYRHTIATQFYEKGVSLQSIRDYLGHDYEEMTQQYVDYMPKKIDKASEEYFSQHSLASYLRKGVNKNGK